MIITARGTFYWSNKEAQTADLDAKSCGGSHEDGEFNVRLPTYGCTMDDTVTVTACARYGQGPCL
jgi:hypothetical protein